MSSTTSPSNQDSSVAAGAPTTFSDHFKLLDQRTLYVDPSGDVELVAIHGDESKTFCVSSHAMRHASPAWRAMLDPANGFNEASFGEKPVKLHDDDFEALFIVLLASHLKFLDIPAKVEFDILVEICVVVDKYDCIGVLSPWLPGWVSQLATESHISENGPEWSFVAWITGNEEIFKHTTYQILISCKTNDSGECIDCSGDILDEVLPPGVSNSIIEARSGIITDFGIHLKVFVAKYSSGNGSTCNGTWRQDECQAFMLGQLFTQLRKFGFLGDVEFLENSVETLRDRSLEDISKAVKEIHKHMYPDNGQSKHLNKHHVSCGFSHELKATVDSLIYGDKSRTVLLDSNRNHLAAQLKKIKPSGVHLARYQTRKTR